MSAEQSIARKSARLKRAAAFQCDKSIHASKLLLENICFGCQFDGVGSAVALHPESVATDEHPCWLHLDSNDEKALEWIRQTKLVPELAKKELLKTQMYSKIMRFEEGIFLNLKGVSYNADNLPDPIVTLNIFITPCLILSILNQRIDMMEPMQKQLAKGVGPCNTAEWLCQIIDYIAQQSHMSIEHIHIRTSNLEDYVLNQHMVSHRDISSIRRQLIILHRLMVPQRDLAAKLSTEKVSWLDDNDRSHLQNSSASIGHYIDDINSSLLRIASLMDQINALLAEETNRRIYWITVFTLIFSPIMFFTSLLGVNLAGIPFSENKLAFGLFVLLLLLITIIVVWILKWKKWF